MVLTELPETNLLLTSDTLYPTPTSSNSTPEMVVPSQLNLINKYIMVSHEVLQTY